MLIEPPCLQPQSSSELAALLAEARARGQTVTLGGAFSKQSMAGPLPASDVVISTRRLDRVLQYEPRDLTLSVEAGARFADVSRVLAAQNQMIPLDVPFYENSTVGGVLAANLSGPRRRLYGTARDMVIGMTFATLEGKLVQSGGMVVKNVAGLDMAKLLIGSFGTLAAMVSVNFKLYPIPSHTRTFRRELRSAPEAIAARDAVLASLLQPAAIDILKAADSYRLLIQAGGSAKVLERYSGELAGYAVIEGAEEESLWTDIREFTPHWMAAHPAGAVVRISCRLSEVGAWLERFPGPAVARSASGVVYGYFENAADARGYPLIEHAPPEFRETETLWAVPGDDFAMMEKVKRMFDPDLLLNRNRLYGRL